LVVAGRTLALATPLVLDGDEVLAPLAPTLRLLGAKADIKDNSVTITAHDDRCIALTVGSTIAQALGGKINLPTAPRQIDGTLYLPARALAPWLDAEARYDEQSRSLSLYPLLNISYAKEPDGATTVHVRSGAPLQYRSGDISDPPRLFFDFQQVSLGMAEQQVPVEEGIIERMRLSQYSVTPEVVRLVIDLNEPGAVNSMISDQGRQLNITIAAHPGPQPTPGGTVGTIKLTGIALTQPGAQQSELAVVTDGPALVDSDYDAKTHKLVLSFTNGVNTIPPEQLKALRDAQVATVNAETTTPGMRLTITFNSDIGYLIHREETGIRVLMGIFNINDMLVVLDAGHGGHDTGAIGSHTLEKDVNLDIILRTGRLLETAGARVLYTRQDDTFIPLDDRPGLANTHAADLFIAVHCNSTTVRNSCSGTQTYYNTPQSAPLAAAIQSEEVNSIDLPNGGVRTANFLVIRKSHMPAVLVEIGFLNNTKEEALLNTPAFRQRAAEGIVNGIRRYAATRAWQLRRADHTATFAAAIP